MWAAMTAVFLVHGICGFPTGAPDFACKSPVPKHKGITPITAGPSTPFSLVQSKRDFVGGDIINVTLSAESKPYKGFFVRAYLEDESQPAGEFLAKSGANLISKCSAITHSDRTPKHEVLLRWAAPKGVSSGKVHFRATVVEEYKRVYVGVKSE